MSARKIRVTVAIHDFVPAVYVDVPDGWDSWSPYRQQVHMAEVAMATSLRVARATAEMVENQCTYTFGHTRDWCGSELCREPR